ncbi:MAG: hypothetical protein ACYC6L_12730 [Anaerolineae bacterium]
MSGFRSRTYYTANERTVEIQQRRAQALGLRLEYNKPSGRVDVCRGEARIRELVTGVELHAFLGGYAAALKGEQ